MTTDVPGRVRWSDEKLTDLQSEFYKHISEFAEHKEEIHDHLAQFAIHRDEMHTFVKVIFPSHAMDEERLITAIKAAFPVNSDGGPDFSGHRSSHEAMIKAAKAQEEFWIDLKRDVAKKGTFALLVMILGLVMVGLTTKLGIKLP